MHFIFNNSFRKSYPLRDNVQKNIVEPDRPQMAVWRILFACWLTKATGTLSEYIILITFQRQQWLRERASLCIRTLSVLLNCCCHAVCGKCMYPPHQQLITLESEKRYGSPHSIIEIWRCIILLDDDVSTFSSYGHKR